MAPLCIYYDPSTISHRYVLSGTYDSGVGNCLKLRVSSLFRLYHIYHYMSPLSSCKSKISLWAAVVMFLSYKPVSYIEHRVHATVSPQCGATMATQSKVGLLEKNATTLPFKLGHLSLFLGLIYSSICSGDFRFNFKGIVIYMTI